MRIPATKILVVEDSELFRRFIVSTLQRSGKFQIIEALNGLEALQKAEELLPDLALLDIGLPDPNGIEIARRLQKLALAPKIVFVSQECSSDVVGEALNVGALGYVHKMHASRDLLPAIESVLSGKRFVSSGLIGDGKHPALSHIQSHEVVFCSSDEAALETLADFIFAALSTGDAAGLWATKSHRKSLLERLRARDLDIDGAIQRGAYVALDVAEPADLAQTSRFVEGLFEAASKANKERPRVVLCGERAGLLWAEGKLDEAFRVEQLCNHMAERHEIDILCVYPSNPCGNEKGDHAFTEICAEHSAVQFR